MNLSRMVRRVAQPVAGQSLVFSAILFFVLIGFAALAIDTGEAFSRQRQQQAASTAASIAGLESMNSEIDGTDGAVQQAIRDALAANGITNAIYISGEWGDLDPTKNYYRAFYTQRGTRVEYPVGSGGDVSPEFNGLRVEVRSARNTIFAQTLGVDTLEVSAENKATLCQCATNIFPMAVSTQKILGMLPGDSVTLNWTKNKVGASIEKDYFVWAEWQTISGLNADNRLKQSLGGTGDVIKGVSEASPPPGYSNSSNNGIINIDDWIKVSDSTLNPKAASLATTLTALKGKPILIPTFTKLSYSGSTGSEKYVSFRSGGFIKVILQDFTTTGIKIQYINSNYQCPCVDVPIDTPVEVKVALDQKLIWYLPSIGTTSYDISLVVDISGSMQWCYNSQNTCSVDANSRWYRVKDFLKKFSYKMLDAWNAPAGADMRNPGLFGDADIRGQGGDNRLAAIRFSNNAHTGSPSFGFTTALMPRTDQVAVNARTLEGRNSMNALINWITKGNMTGSTSGGRGLREGIRYFDNVSAHNRVDRNGRPIKLVMLMLTDGLTNVMYEGNQVAQQNTQKLQHTRSGGSKYCKDPNDPSAGNTLTPGRDAYPITDLPEVQANCPWNGQGSGNGYAKAPIVSLVEVATQARNRVSPQRPINIYAILVGDQGSYDLYDLRIDQIASPGGAFYAQDSNSLDNALEVILDDLSIPCYERDATIVAAGAKVTVRDSTGSIVAGMSEMQASPTGTLLFTVPEPGSYTLEAKRQVNNWSEFPLGNGETMNQSLYPVGYLPHLYNRLRGAEDTNIVPSIAFSVPEEAEGLIDIGKYTLIISSAHENKGRCP
ncbi:TadE/TadG family protein [Herpetosiphon llansteffanensis]